MRFELLGTLRAVDEDGIHQISAQKIEILLAVLLINGNHVVTTDQLVTEIWGEDPPRRAISGLHVYVSELRKFLRRPGRADNLITTRSPGYLFSPSRSDELDHLEFRDLAERGRLSIRLGHHREAAACLAAALELWRGPELGGAGPGPIVRGFATWASEVRMECTELLIDAQLELGRHRELVGRLRSLTTENPLYEPFYRQLMLALYRSDRRSDALRVYQGARSTLIDELGVEPCTPLRDLHRAILLADERVLSRSQSTRPSVTRRSA